MPLSFGLILRRFRGNPGKLDKDLRNRLVGWLADRVGLRSLLGGQCRFSGDWWLDSDFWFGDLFRHGVRLDEALGRGLGHRLGGLGDWLRIGHVFGHWVLDFQNLFGTI